MQVIYRSNLDPGALTIQVLVFYIQNSRVYIPNSTLQIAQNSTFKKEQRLFNLKQGGYGQYKGKDRLHLGINEFEKCMPPPALIAKLLPLVGEAGLPIHAAIEQAIEHNMKAGGTSRCYNITPALFCNSCLNNCTVVCLFCTVRAHR
jgi:hypothetical protein